MYKDNSLQQYLDDLAAKLPAPGGGSAASLAAALAAALLSMVINFTLGKPKYVQYEQELKEMLEVSEQLRKGFLDLVDEDVAAYKSKDVRKSLEVPLRVCRLCADAIMLCPDLVQKGNRNLISDVACAAVLLESAFSSALYNVDINLRLLADKELSKTIKAELVEHEKLIKNARTHTEAEVGKIIRG